MNAVGKDDDNALGEDNEGVNAVKREKAEVVVVVVHDGDTTAVDARE